jgi:hypothetical protein
LGSVCGGISGGLLGEASGEVLGGAAGKVLGGAAGEVRRRASGGCVILSIPLEIWRVGRDGITRRDTAVGVVYSGG